MAVSPRYLMESDLATEEVLSRSSVPGLRGITRMTYTQDRLWLVISHLRSLSVLDAQTGVPVADLPLDTEAPTDAFAVADGFGRCAAQ